MEVGNHRRAVERIAFDAKALSENKKAGILAFTLRSAPSQTLDGSNGITPRETECDLQLRDSSRIARDSLLAALFRGQNLIVHCFKVLLHRQVGDVAGLPMRMQRYEIKWIGKKILRITNHSYSPCREMCVFLQHKKNYSINDKNLS